MNCRSLTRNVGAIAATVALAAGCQTPPTNAPQPVNHELNAQNSVVDSKISKFHLSYWVDVNQYVTTPPVPVEVPPNNGYDPQWATYYEPDGTEHRFIYYPGDGSYNYVDGKRYNWWYRGYGYAQPYHSNSSPSPAPTSGPGTGGSGGNGGPNGPAPSPSPAVIDLKAAPAFSPNGDGNKDTSEVTIQAQDSWQLEVVGHPGTLSGAPLDKSGNRTFPWDGAVNGTTLPDGKYTLRLTAGTEVKTAEVSIDTQAPEIKALTYLAVDNNAAMEVSANILDKVADGASGIDEASITVSLQENNVAFGTRNFESTLGSFSQKLDVEKLQEFFSGIPRIPGAKKPLMVEARDLAGNKVSAELKDASNIKKETLSLNFDSGYHVAAVNDNPNNPIIRPLLAQRIVHNSELFTGDAQIIWNYQKRGSENGRVVFKHDWRTGRNRIVNLSFEFNCKDNKYNFIQNGFIPLPEGQYFSTYETAWGDILNSHAYRIENRIAYKDPTLIEMHGILFDKLVKKDWLDFFGGNGLKEVSKNWKLVFGPLIDSKMKHPEQIDFAWASYNIVLKREFNATIQDKSYLFVDDEDGRGPWTAYVQYEGDVDSHPVVIRTIREYDIRTNTIIEHVIDAFVKN